MYRASLMKRFNNDFDTSLYVGGDSTDLIDSLTLDFLHKEALKSGRRVTHCTIIAHNPAKNPPLSISNLAKPRCGRIEITQQRLFSLHIACEFRIVDLECVVLWSFRRHDCDALDKSLIPAGDVVSEENLFRFASHVDGLYPYATRKGFAKGYPWSVGNLFKASSSHLKWCC